MGEILLGIDYGETNTGLAFGRNGFVNPLRILPSKDEGALIAEISRTVAENRVTKIIFGLPTTIENKETDQSRKTRRFAKLIKIKTKRPVDFVSEHGTSKESLQTAIKVGISQKRRKTNDHLSAALILKRYYEELAENQQTQ